jgi:hypothetical protein
MLALARSLAVGRLAAMAVAFALTGAPGLAELHAPEREHRCTCRAAGRVHECACPRCHAAARAAGEAPTPPCHRAAPGAPAPAATRDPAAPCWTGSCGAPEAPVTSLLALEAFTVPAGSRLPAPPPAGRVLLAVGEPHELLLSPDPPPPRAA